MQDPLKLPQPPNYGYVGDIPIQRTQPKLPQVVAPEDAFPQQKMQMPDVVKARYGLGDKNTVAALLRAANGEDSGLVGVTSTYATKLLQSANMPTTMDAWTAEPASEEAMTTTDGCQYWRR